jgi:hypothetical protein
MIRFLTMPSANDLFSHPLQWAGKHLALYAAAAAIAGAAFVAGSALYSRLAPTPASPEIHKPVPLKFAPAADPADPKLVPSGEEKNAPLIANGEWIPIGITIGARVLDTNRNEIGKIKAVTLTPVGETKVSVMKMDGKLVTLPAASFVWKTTPSTTYATTLGSYSVEAIAKRPFKQLEDY